MLSSGTNSARTRKNMRRETPLDVSYIYVAYIDVSRIPNSDLNYANARDTWSVNNLDNRNELFFFNKMIST